MRQNHSNLGVLSKLEDDVEVKIPQDILNRAGFVSGDRLFFEIVNESIVISKAGSPKEGTLEYLFKDYGGGSFQTSLVDLGDAAGKEKW